MPNRRAAKRPLNLFACAYTALSWRKELLLFSNVMSREMDGDLSAAIAELSNSIVTASA